MSHSYVIPLAWPIDSRRAKAGPASPFLSIGRSGALRRSARNRCCRREMSELSMEHHVDASGASLMRPGWAMAQPFLFADNIMVRLAIPLLLSLCFAVPAVAADLKPDAINNAELRKRAP